MYIIQYTEHVVHQSVYGFMLCLSGREWSALRRKQHYGQCRDALMLTGSVKADTHITITSLCPLLALLSITSRTAEHKKQLKPFQKTCTK